MTESVDQRRHEATRQRGKADKADFWCEQHAQAFAGTLPSWWKRNADYVLIGGALIALAIVITLLALWVPN